MRDKCVYVSPIINRSEIRHFLNSAADIFCEHLFNDPQCFTDAIVSVSPGSSSGRVTFASRGASMHRV